MARPGDGPLPGVTRAPPAALRAHLPPRAKPMHVIEPNPVEGADLDRAAPRRCTTAGASGRWRDAHPLPRVLRAPRMHIPGGVFQRLAAPRAVHPGRPRRLPLPGCREPPHPCRLRRFPGHGSGVVVDPQAGRRRGVRRHTPVSIPPHNAHRQNAASAADHRIHHHGRAEPLADQERVGHRRTAGSCAHRSRSTHPSWSIPAAGSRTSSAGSCRR
jgi:hypothetical protein